MADEIIVNDRREIDQIILKRLDTFEKKLDDAEKRQVDQSNNTLSKFLSELNKFVLDIQDELREHDRRLNDHSIRFTQIETSRISAEKFHKENENKRQHWWSLWVPITIGTVIATALGMLATYLMRP